MSSELETPVQSADRLGEPRRAAGGAGAAGERDRERARPDLAALRMDPDELEYRPRRRWIGWLIVLAAAGALAAWALLAPAPFLLPRVETTTVQVVTPTEASTVLTATGYTYARERAAVGAKIIGRVVELRVDEGDQVRQGDVIAVLDSADLRAAIDQNRAALQEVRAKLADAGRERARQEKLVAAGASPQATLDVSIRGVEPAAFDIRTQVRLVDGRRFEPGKAEVIVGRQLLANYPALRLGSTVSFGRVPFRVVGIFAAGGSSLESEVWGAVADLNAAFRRISSYSSALLHAASPDDARALIARIQGDQQLHLQALAEPRYYAEQANVASAQFIILGNLLAVFLAVGACFAAANTMFAQVSARGHEIGTLRALGFRRHTILLAFMIEAAVLGLVAGVAGALLALPLNGITAATMNGITFSEITFSLRTAPWILGMGVLLALGTGVVGGFPAAWSAARRPITELLREH